MFRAFAITHTWPDVRNAEYEVLQRVIKAADNAGFGTVVVDNSGIILWASPQLPLREGDRVRHGDVEFLLSLHFESPRLLDIYSYYALWQPIQFYEDFGYQVSIDKFTSHNDLISCSSDLADAHALNLMTGLERSPALPLPTMFHMLPEPFLAPAIGPGARLFYVGINWERLGRPKGRFHDTLVGLDTLDLIDIYGPEKMFGKAPWEGFKTYRGELPFDGQSIKRAINRAGICLALSSASHRETGIMSNRLFEGFAGGAAVIATPNAIIDKYFADIVYLVDDSRGEEQLAQAIREAVHEIRDDLVEAERRVVEGQRRLREICSLEDSLRHLFEGHAGRVGHFEAAMLAQADVTVVLIDDFGSVDLLKARIEDYRAQRKASVRLHIVCDRAVGVQLGRSDTLAGGALAQVVVHPLLLQPAAPRFEGVVPVADRTGAKVHEILTASDTPYFMIAGANEVVFSDHLASLAKVMEREDAPLACSGAITQNGDVAGRTSRALASMRFVEPHSLLMVAGVTGRARFLFRSSLRREDASSLMRLLDGEEHRYYQLLASMTGDPGQTGYATYMVDLSLGLAARLPAETSARQHQYVRDRFFNDSRRLQRLAMFGSLPHDRGQAVQASPPVTYRRPLPLNEMVRTGEGGAGLVYLTEGFSHPEPHHIWIMRGPAMLDFMLPEDVSDGRAEFDLVLQVVGRRSRETRREQHCSVFVNGLCLAYRAVPDKRTELRLRLPSGIVRRTADLRVEIVPDHAELADSFDGGADTRHLSIMLLAFGILAEDDRERPTLAGDSIYRCGSDMPIIPALVRGFYAPEPRLTWQAGREGTIAFHLTLVPHRPELVLGVWGRPARATGEVQELSVAINGTVVATLDIEDRIARHTFPIDRDLLVGGDVTVTLTVRHAEAVYDENGMLIDGRLLGLALTEFGIVETEPEYEAPESPGGTDLPGEDGEA